MFFFDPRRTSTTRTLVNKKKIRTFEGAGSEREREREKEREKEREREREEEKSRG